MRGRIWAQFLFLLIEGILMLVFSLQKSLGPAVASLMFFSIFVQASSGAIFGTVPYVDPSNKGNNIILLFFYLLLICDYFISFLFLSFLLCYLLLFVNIIVLIRITLLSTFTIASDISGAVYGAVGAGGNLGAVFWGLIFLYNSDTQVALRVLSYIVICSSGTCALLKFPGYSWMLWGVDEPEKQVIGRPVAMGLRGMTFEQALDLATGEEGVDMVKIQNGKMVKKFASCDDLTALPEVEEVDEDLKADELQQRNEENKANNQ